MVRASTHRRQFGQYFTPSPVVAFCYALLSGRLASRPRIVDPACGDGAFLRFAAEMALAAPEDIVGCDVDGSLIHELAADVPGVYLEDGLTSPHLANGTYDLVIGNPPYGVATAEPNKSNFASEVRFLLRALELARSGGYVALVLPNGVLANERLRELRADLLQRSTLLASIALPRDTFRAAGTTAACAVVLLHNAIPPKEHRVFFASPQRLADLEQTAAHFRTKVQKEDHGTWLRQDQALARRLDAPFWHPEHRQLHQRLAARHPLCALGDVLDVRRDLIAGDHVRPSRGEKKGPGLPYEYYQTREFMAAGYNYVAVERCDERAYQRLRRTSVRQYDILVSCAGVGGAGRGRVCLVTHTPGPSCTGDVLIVRPSRINPIFLFLFLRSTVGRTQLLRLQNGVGTVNLSVDELLQVEVPLVSEAVQQSLAKEYADVAAAHAQAMDARRNGNSAAFARSTALAEERLSALTHKVEALVLG